MDNSDSPLGDDVARRPSDEVSGAPELLFREFDRGEVANPVPGEILVAPALAKDRDRRDMALLVLERGLAGLPRGEGEVRRVVVQVDPTFDDLLAATIALRLLSGDEVPPGLMSFARYAALAREGLKPGEVPMEVSLAGVFLATRAACGGDLTDSATASRFLADWPRLATAIFRAGTAGSDPFTSPLIAAGSEFARERAYLARDHVVYRQDVARGERWRVRLPDGPPQGAGLLLRRPRSVLFKYWCREDPEAPRGQGFLFLAVGWGEGQWVFSTDPVHRLSIRTLANTMQAAEEAVDRERATRDPWFDGKPFGYTLVAAPRAGTNMSDKQILGIVKVWSRARTVDVSSRRTILKLTAALPLVGIGGVLTWKWALPYGQFQQSQEFRSQTSRPGEINLHVLTIGVSKYPPGMTQLPCAVEDAKAIAAAFERFGGRRPFDRVYCRQPLVDPYSTSDGIYNAIKQLCNALDGGDDDRRRAHRNDLGILYFAGHGKALDGDQFYFLPSDFDPEAKTLESSAVDWNKIGAMLAKVPCTMLVLMDACEAGPITRRTIKSPLGTSGVRPIGRGGRSLDTPSVLDLEVEQIRLAFSKSSPKLVTLAAAASSASALESPLWKHSAFALALLERVTGEFLIEDNSKMRRPLADPGVVSLRQLQDYVKARVYEITQGRQKIVPFDSGDLIAEDIPIAFIGGR